MMYYNFVRIAPAMPAGISSGLWEVSDIVALWEAVESKVGKRRPYKKRSA
jgi:hypothetical protein